MLVYDRTRYMREQWQGDDVIYFWSGRSGAHKEFSNFARSRFVIALRFDPTVKVQVPTGEHGFHLGKVGAYPTREENLAAVEQIMASEEPLDAKHAAGRGRLKLIDGWDDLIRFDWMLEVSRAKYAQNPRLAELLLSTGEMILVEDSPYDDVWGGRDRRGGYRGRNMLGRCLMRVRWELAQQQNTQLALS